MSPFVLAMAFGVSAVTLPISAVLCRKFGIVDRPGGRKTHRGRIPLAGGPAFLMTFALLGWLAGPLTGVTTALVGALSLLFIPGFIDDLRGVVPAARLLTTALVASLWIGWAGAPVVPDLGDLMGVGVIQLGALSAIFTVVAYVGMVNAVNMVDGVDGLSSGLVLLGLGTIGALWAMAAPPSAPLPSLLAVVTAVVLPFFLWNFPFWRPATQGRPSRSGVFLGDSGAMILGFLLAWACIEGAVTGGLPPVAMLLAAAVPLIDMWAVMGWRIRTGKSPLDPGRDHLHHRLMERGLSPAQTTAALLGAGLIFALGAGAVTAGWIPEWIGFLTFLIALSGAYAWIRHA